MKTEAELDAMHEAIVARFPAGLTPTQYRQVILESADEDGRVYPHSVSVPGEPFAQQSLLIGMWFDGLLEQIHDGSGRPNWHQPLQYKITDRGRAALSASQSSTDRRDEP